MPGDKPHQIKPGSKPLILRDQLVTRVRHDTIFRKVTIVRTERLQRWCVRLTFSGEELRGFYSPGFDDHLKVLVPSSNGELIPPVMSPNGPVFPGGTKPVMRDYTPRRYDARANELVIDFALHDAGPATAWAAAAIVGGKAGIGGPRGSMIVSTDLIDRHVLVGDETSAPAIARRLEELPVGSRAEVFIEVDQPGDELKLGSAAQGDIAWCYRQGAPAGSVLLEKVRSAGLQTEGAYAWIACESATAKALRAHLVRDRGFDPVWIKASGYWRRGATAVHDLHGDEA